ncbi:hypothetical protein IscW_ISCW001541 [Ixodes scapularis]|uniref:Uncharacterized protein n=1 Tax=Ixodes scapularis TaxID=6945 RepID=B7P644_IXOSC|nr:hypothetical protein IscW_ISCW001541 [Ixodes scapularis]|eukprot:XP_002408408.1 hypothetical protein IscW_ISCW001541 [Ixodes scapularis]
MGAARPPERNASSSVITISSPFIVDGDGVAATAERWPGVGGDRLSPAPGSGRLPQLGSRQVGPGPGQQVQVDVSVCFLRMLALPASMEAAVPLLRGGCSDPFTPAALVPAPSANGQAEDVDPDP